MSKKNIIFGPIKQSNKPVDLVTTTNQQPNNARSSSS